MTVETPVQTYAELLDAAFDGDFDDTDLDHALGATKGRF